MEEFNAGLLLIINFTRIDINYIIIYLYFSKPAILPLTTDYLPSVDSIRNFYEAKVPYELTLDADSPFDCLGSMLIEMVCQRLTQEYQLIDKDKISIEPYRKMINSSGKFTFLFNF